MLHLHNTLRSQLKTTELKTTPAKKQHNTTYYT